MSKEEIKSIIIHNAKHLGSVDVHMQNLLIDVNMLVEQLANIERQARLDTYKKLIKYTQDKYQEFVTKEELEVFIKELERGE